SFPRRLASPGSVEHQLDERSQPETSVVPAGFGTSWCSNLPGVLHYGGDWIHICWSTSISTQNWTGTSSAPAKVDFSLGRATLAPTSPICRAEHETFPAHAFILSGHYGPRAAITPFLA